MLFKVIHFINLSFCQVLHTALKCGIMCTKVTGIRLKLLISNYLIVRRLIVMKTR